MVTWKVMREGDVTDGQGETPGTRTGGQEGIEIVPVTETKVRGGAERWGYTTRVDRSSI